MSIPHQVSLDEKLSPAAEVIDCSVEAANQFGQSEDARLFKLTGGKLVLRTKILLSPAKTRVVLERFDKMQMSQRRNIKRMAYAKLGTFGDSPTYVARLILEPVGPRAQWTFRSVGNGKGENDHDHLTNDISIMVWYPSF